MGFLPYLFLAVFLLLLCLFLEMKLRSPYKPAICTLYDQIAIDHAILVLHAYACIKKKQPINFQKKITENIYLHYPKPKAMYEAWIFHPLYKEASETMNWLPYFKDKRSMLGCLGINPNKKIVTIAFRSSRTLNDWLHNVDLSFKRYSNIGYHGYLHGGYMKIFNNLLSSIHDVLRKIIATTSKLDKYRFIITGHSLGGALAVISAIYFVQHPKYSNYFRPDNTKLITFGTPYISAKSSQCDFRKWVRKHIGYVKCFERSTDMMPIIPKFVKEQTQKTLSLLKKGYEVIRPIPPTAPTKLFHFHNSRFNLVGAHSICKYRKGIYKELKLPYHAVYGYRIFRALA